MIQQCQKLVIIIIFEPVTILSTQVCISVLGSRSLHTESEMFIRNFLTLKNKYDLMLCQSRLHTASGKNSDQVRFSAFSHP